MLPITCSGFCRWITQFRRMSHRRLRCWMNAVHIVMQIFRVIVSRMVGHWSELTTTHWGQTCRQRWRFIWGISLKMYKHVNFQSNISHSQLSQGGNISEKNSFSLLLFLNLFSWLSHLIIFFLYYLRLCSSFPNWGYVIDFNFLKFILLLLKTN